MVFRKPGNSRDDKPQRASGRPAKSGDTARNSSSKTGSSAPKYKSKSSDESPSRGRKTSGGAGDSSYSSKNTGKPYGDRPAKSSSAKPYGNRSESDKPYGDKSSGSAFARPYGEKTPRKSSAKPYTGRPDSGNSTKSYGDRPYSGRPERGASDKPYSSRGGSSDKPYGDRSNSRSSSPDKPFNRRPPETNQPGEDRPERRSTGKPQLGERSFAKRTPAGPPRDKDNRGYTKSFDRPNRGPRKAEDGAEQPARTMRSKKASATVKDDGLIRLNRYISNAGICSRRKADELIMAGVVSVNGEVISELGHKVDPMKDIIRYNGETLKREKMVYVLLNKPKDYITTTDDPQERRTVMHLVEKASKERIYPVGRLDRNTTGLLLMTNDGDLADKLSHPKNSISKLYMVELDKSLSQGDLNKIGFGLELEDGFIKPDSVSYVQGGTKKEIGIQIHSGRNRIVRRIFEHLGYDVIKLDRSVYANLTKKDLPRGRWRMLDEKEVIQLKHLV